MTAVKKVAVIGAGVMGAGIAAHVANAGIPCVLLDIVPDGAADRNVIAEGAVNKMLKADPAPFMHARNARLITPGNIEDNLPLLSDCDWIIEAVIERQDIKQDLYRKIDEIRKPGAIVSSNTSTLPISVLTKGMPDSFSRDFLITHFFNPPRYMRLLEIVSGEKTRANAVTAITDFADRQLGKSVVDCNDTPGFIANRIGTYWLQCAVIEAMDSGITIEEADAIIGRPMGIPKTGVFGLIDLVGLDLMPHVLNGLAGTLPKTDAFHAIYRQPELIKKMIADGYTGRKGKGGFYRLTKKDDGKRVKEGIDLATGDYRPSIRPDLKSVAAGNKKGLRALVEHPDPTGQYGWRVLSRTLAYAASLVPEIADDIAAVDEAMRLGYNWKFGPFELIDKLGPSWFAGRLKADGVAVPPLLETAGDKKFYRVEQGSAQYLGVDGAYHDIPRPDGVIMLSDIKRRGKPVESNRSASLWDIGDGILCLEFHTKMNALGPGVLSMARKAVEIIPGKYKGLVIYNEGSNFSVGANIGLLLVLSILRLSFLVSWVVGKGQDTYKELKFAPFPVVSAPSGMALGGGCEILLHSDAVQAHAETYTGLVEVGVGIIPGWGGCKELLIRWWNDPKRPKGPMPVVSKAFETISMAKIAKSAAEARDYLFLRPGDGITMNRYRLLADARDKALSLVDGYEPPLPVELSLPGPSARVGMEMAVDGFRKRGLATPHDVNVAGALAIVLSGGDTDIVRTITEDDLLRLERRELTRLTRFPETIARVKHMLKTGRPLRN
ncbi:MAG: 3-hydroxyacyl-CoA dehydrogenase [Rhodospirillaceae bacterium]|jgi:3-hydroxyacyl-CoA dehydrogenase|nr:3-hydroxyacyl-CoA dehydrogenase [Rhodospirillaceae bacterium]MBT5458261.1 3-hydroxyacyl-CoA dehydrogenase [Rhodospirillaceae bacterium]